MTEINMDNEMLSLLQGIDAKLDKLLETMSAKETYSVKVENLVGGRAFCAGADQISPQKKHRYGHYHHVPLSEDELSELRDELSEDEIKRCILHIDQYIETFGNRNHWLNFHLVILRCSREKWYARYVPTEWTECGAETMGERIKTLRTRAGMTQTQLAEALGTVRTAIANWESGKSNPKTAELPNLARVLRCSIDELFERQDNKKAANGGG